MKIREAAFACDAQAYVKEQNQDRWRGTIFEGYKFLGNKQKGQFGERILDAMFEGMGCVVRPPLNPGHDTIINGIRMEYKFSLAMTSKGQIQKNMWMMNHVARGKDWNWLCFCGINPDGDDRLMLLSKENFVWILENENYTREDGKVRNRYFGAQQGGEKADNDDWMCTAKNLQALMESKYTIGLDEWLQRYGLETA
jgi:hypothetical protein